MGRVVGVGLLLILLLAILWTFAPYPASGAASCPSEAQWAWAAGRASAGHPARFQRFEGRVAQAIMDKVADDHGKPAIPGISALLSVTSEGAVAIGLNLGDGVCMAMKLADEKPFQSAVEGVRGVEL